MRRTLQDIANGMLPEAIGLCAGDLPRLAQRINLATQNFTYEGGETGFWGGWDKITFVVCKDDPYVTAPGLYARVVNLNVCRYPIRIQNEWYETMEAGIGLQRPDKRCQTGILEAYDRGTVTTAYCLKPTNQVLRVYPTNPADVGKRILFSNAKDSNGQGIYTQDSLNRVNGFYVTIDTPFADAKDVNGNPLIVTSFGSVNKDVTSGDVVVNQVDQNTLEELPLARYFPTETNPVYRRFYINRLPIECCGTCNTSGVKTVQVTCMCKLEYRPVSQPSDFLIYANEPALIAECESIRYARMDGADAQAMSVLKHRQAIGHLNAELTHYLGIERPAVVFAPFGNARLERAGVGLII